MSFTLSREFSTDALSESVIDPKLRAWVDQAGEGFTYPPASVVTTPSQPVFA